MPAVRLEPLTFGATLSHEGGIVETVTGIPAETATIAPGAQSEIAFGPVEDRMNLLVKPIGCQIYVAFGVAPAAGPAPARSYHVLAGGFVLLELERGDKVALALADLS